MSKKSGICQNHFFACNACNYDGFLKIIKFLTYALQTLSILLLFANLQVECYDCIFQTINWFHSCLVESSDSMFENSHVHVWNANCTSKLSFSYSKCTVLVNILIFLIFTHLFVHHMYRVNDEIFIPTLSVM
jgi:hypothetical protein